MIPATKNGTLDKPNMLLDFRTELEGKILGRRLDGISHCKSDTNVYNFDANIESVPSQISDIQIEIEPHLQPQKSSIQNSYAPQIPPKPMAKESLDVSHQKRPPPLLPKPKPRIALKPNLTERNMGNCIFVNKDKSVKSTSEESLADSGISHETSNMSTISNIQQHNETDVDADVESQTAESSSQCPINSPFTKSQSLTTDMTQNLKTELNKLFKAKTKDSRKIRRVSAQPQVEKKVEITVISATPPRVDSNSELITARIKRPKKSKSSVSSSSKNQRASRESATFYPVCDDNTRESVLSETSMEDTEVFNNDNDSGVGGGASPKSCMSLNSLYGSQSVTPTNSMYENDKLSDQATKYTKRAAEIVETELKFVRKCILIGEGFPRFLRENEEYNKDSVCLVIADEISNAFQMVILGHKMLLDEFRKVWAEWNEIQPNLAGAFNKVCQFLKQDQDYLPKKAELEKRLNDACNNKSCPLQKALDIFNSEYLGKGCVGLTMELDQVHLRIGKYELLFEAYHKYLPDEFKEEKERALNSIAGAKKCATSMNDYLRVLEGFKELNKLMDRISNVPSFQMITASRKFLKEGTVLKVSRKENQKRHLILLSDHLLVCRLGTVGVPTNQLSIGHEIQLLPTSKNATTRVTIEDSDIRPHSFKVLSLKKSFIFQAENEREMQSWVEEIQNAVCQMRLRKDSFAVNNNNNNNDVYVPETDETPATQSACPVGETAPEWIPDNDVTKCQHCRNNFTTIFRRHHCRGCGKVICNSCCGNAPLHYKHWKTQRVCPTCFHEVNQWARNVSCPLLRVILNNKEFVKPRNAVVRPNSAIGDTHDLISGFVEWWDINKRVYLKAKVYLKIIKKDIFVLEAFNAPKDVDPMAKLPLLNCNWSQHKEGVETTVIEITHNNQFADNNNKHNALVRFKIHDQHAQKWVHNLEMCLENCDEKVADDFDDDFESEDGTN